MIANRINTINEVIQIIRNHENKHRVILNLYDSEVQRFFLYISIVTLIGSCSILLTNPTEIYDLIVAFFLLGVSAIFIFLYTILTTYIPTLKTLFKPMDSTFERIQKRMEREDELINKLADVETSTLEQTIKRLRYEADFWEGRNSEASGLFQKLSIIPVVVALYIAYSKKDIPNEQLFFTYIPYVLVFFISLYIIILIMRGVIERLKFYILIIESAKFKAEIKSTLQIQRQ